MPDVECRVFRMPVWHLLWFLLPMRASFFEVKGTKVSNWPLAVGRRSAFDTLRRGQDFAQGQVGGEKSGEPQHAKPQDDIKVLVDPVLRLLVVESVNIINVDGEVGVGQMGAGGRSKKIADEHQPCGQAGPGRQSPFVVAQAEQEPDEQQGQPAMKER